MDGNIFVVMAIRCIEGECRNIAVDPIQKCPPTQLDMIKIEWWDILLGAPESVEKRIEAMVEAVSQT